MGGLSFLEMYEFLIHEGGLFGIGVGPWWSKIPRDLVCRPFKVPPLVAPFLRECEVPRIGVFGGFAIVKLSWDFELILFLRVRS